MRLLLQDNRNNTGSPVLESPQQDRSIEEESDPYAMVEPV